MKLRPNAIIGIAGLGLVAIVAIGGVLVSPYQAMETNFLNRFATPSASHWFGTDEYGRDVFTRVAVGSFITLRVSLAAVALAIVAGTVTGAMAAYFGGWLDRAAMLVSDSIMAFPSLLLLLGIMAALGPNEWGVILALAIAYTPPITRVVRSAVIAALAREYVTSSQLIGNGDLTTLFRHVLPNCITPFIVIATSVFTAAVLSEAALSFLGLGVPPPAPSWGSMLADSRNYLGINPWMAIFPGIAITVTLLSINLVGDALRDRFDLRMAGGD
ncbi:MAG: ABC transporter permease [Pseudomonadota bacterium]